MTDNSLRAQNYRWKLLIYPESFRRMAPEPMDFDHNLQQYDIIKY